MSSHLIRVKAESKNSSSSVADATTKEPLFWWRGNDISIDISLSTHGRFLLATDIGEITLVVKNADALSSDVPRMLKVLTSSDCNDDFEASQWEQGTNQLCTVNFTRAEAALEAGNYVIVVSHDFPDGKRNTYLHSRITVKEDQHEDTTLLAPLPLTVSEQVVELLAAIEESGDLVAAANANAAIVNQKLVEATSLSLASASLTFTDGLTSEDITIGGITYYLGFDPSRQIINGPDVVITSLIGVPVAEMPAILSNHINGLLGASAHPDVSAIHDGLTVTVTSRAFGADGDTIAVSSINDLWDAPNLSGGNDGGFITRSEHEKLTASKARDFVATFEQDLTEEQRATVRENLDLDGPENVRQFNGQLFQTKKLLSNPPINSFPRTSRLSMVTTGDSLAALGFDFGFLLQQQFGIGGFGIGMLGFDLAGGAAEIDDHAEWVRGLHFSVSTGGAVTFNANRGGAFTGDIEVLADTFKVFYKTVAGATLTLETSIDRGATWVNQGTVDCSSGNVAKFSGSLAHYLMRITGETGTSIVFGAEMSVDVDSSGSNTNFQGVVLHDISRSGTTPDQLVEMDAATFGVIMAEVAPVLGLHTNADHQPENEIYLVEMMDRLRAASPSMDNLMVSSNPSDQLAEEKSINADWMRSYQEAQGSGYAFFDAYNFGGDFLTWDANGFADDIIHASSAGRRLIASAIFQGSGLQEAWLARETHGTQARSVKRIIGFDGTDQRAGSTSGASNSGFHILGKNTDSRLGFETPGKAGSRGLIAHENGDMSIEVGTNTLMTFFSTGRVALSRKNSNNANSQPTANGPWFEVESLDAFNAAMRVVARSSASDFRNALEIYRGTNLVARFTSAGWLVPETPEFSDDSAADSSSLPSGGFYRLNGNRTVYRKP